MKTILHHVTTVILATATLTIVGCASVAVSNDAIERNTAASLGLEKGTFTISDRNDDGVKATYAVKTNAGRKYTCYVTGGVSYLGRVVSDAVCTELGKPTRSAVPAVTNSSCNPLLKAAGKC